MRGAARGAATTGDERFPPSGVDFLRVPSGNPSSLLPGALVIGLQKNSSLTAPLTSAMLELKENGLVSQLQRKW